MKCRISIQSCFIISKLLTPTIYLLKIRLSFTFFKRMADMHISLATNLAYILQAIWSEAKKYNLEARLDSVGLAQVKKGSLDILDKLWVNRENFRLVQNVDNEGESIDVVNCVLAVRSTTSVEFKNVVLRSVDAQKKRSYLRDFMRLYLKLKFIANVFSIRLLMSVIVNSINVKYWVIKRHA